MARGHQKEQSKQKNAKKNEAMAKQKGHSVHDQKKSAAAALTFSCTVCKVCCPLRVMSKYQYSKSSPSCVGAQRV